MIRVRQTLPLLLVASLALPLGAAAGVPTEETLTVTSMQQADDRDHPRSHLVPVLVTRPFHRGARVCGYYENDTYHLPEDGRVRLTVGLWRGGERIARVGFKRQTVQSNQLDLGCRDVPRLRRGDTLLFDFRFSEMPRLSPRIFSHGGIVNTYMLVRASVEPPLPKETSSVEFLGVEPGFGSVVPAGGTVKVRIRYSCGQELGCNVTAGFGDQGREVVRGVRQGARGRTLILRCGGASFDRVMEVLTIGIERDWSSPLASVTVPGEITCLGSGFE